MNSADRLRRLFRFNNWSNTKILSVLKEHQNFAYSKKAITILSHILAAEDLWYCRIKGSDISEFDVWPEYTLTKIQEMTDTYPERWKSLISDHEENMDQIISYKNTSGVAYETMLSDILHHIIIHGQHHRAQIALLLRQAEIKPPATDFIFYTRKS